MLSGFSKTSLRLASDSYSGLSNLRTAYLQSGLLQLAAAFIFIGSDFVLTLLQFFTLHLDHCCN